MTLTNQTNKVRESGNGITVAFNFNFKIFQESDIEVYKIDTSVDPEVATLQTITTDYTVGISQTSEGGAITYVVAPTSDEDSFIKRVMPFTQQTVIPINGNFPEKDMEDELDKSRMLDIQVKEETDRTVRINEFTEYTGSLELPEPEASKVIGYDVTGLAMANYSGSDLDTILTTPYGQQLVQSADAEAARIVLELGDTDDVDFGDITGDTISGTTLNATTVEATTYNNLPLLREYGLVVTSSSGDPDEDVDVTKGTHAAFDQSTLIELTADASDLSFPTLNGGALSNNTTYHLFRYKKDDDTMEWYLDTSVTPTIAGIKSAGAYFLVYSGLTDGSGDLYKVAGFPVAGGGAYYIFDKDDTTAATVLTPSSATYVAVPLSFVPLGVQVQPFISIISEHGGASDSILDFKGADLPNAAGVQLQISQEDERAERGQTAADFLRTTTSGEIYYRKSAGAGTPNYFYVQVSGYRVNRVT